MAHGKLLNVFCWINEETTVSYKLIQKFSSVLYLREKKTKKTPHKFIMQYTSLIILIFLKNAKKYIFG